MYANGFFAKCICAQGNAASELLAHRGCCVKLQEVAICRLCRLIMHQDLRCNAITLPLKIEDQLFSRFLAHSDKDVVLEWTLF